MSTEVPNGKLPFTEFEQTKGIASSSGPIRGPIPKGQHVFGEESGVMDTVSPGKAKAQKQSSPGSVGRKK